MKIIETHERLGRLQEQLPTESGTTAAKEIAAYISPATYQGLLRRAIEIIADAPEARKVEVAPQLLAFLRGPDGGVHWRYSVAPILAGIETWPPELMAEVVDLIGHEQDFVRLAAIKILLRHGVPETAAERLRNIIGSKDNFVLRFVAASALHGAQQMQGGSPVRGGTGTVEGKCIHVRAGVPGMLAGRPGKQIPPRGALGTTVYFLSKERLFLVVAGEEGAYRMDLPAGTYEVVAGDMAPKTEIGSLVHVDWSMRPREVQVQAGASTKLDLAASMMFVD